ncbi:NYN domain-containing protein [Spirosoma sordidisoli]|nr:NYN domain-containing protein [Spirosoma sordidisoli]
MENCLIIVDNSNVWIEGQKYSAKAKGVLKTNPNDRDICDPSWRIDFGELLKQVSEGQNIVGAILVGSRPPQSDSIWESADRSGFKVIVHDRNAAGKEKAVDTELAVQGTAAIYSQPTPGVLKLLSGDRDFIPLVNMAAQKGWETEMWAFTSSFTQYGQMAQTVTRIKPLDHCFNEISSYGFTWPVPGSPTV